MNTDFIKNIDIDELVDESIDINELVKNYKKDLESANILQSGEFNGARGKAIVNSSGKFEDTVWVIENTLNSNYRYIDFSQLEKTRFSSKITKEQISSIKCWIADMLLNVNKEDGKRNSGFPGIAQAYSYLVEFINVSDNFSKDFLDKTKGDKLVNFFEERSFGHSDNLKKKIIGDVLKFLSFITFDYEFKNSLYSEKLISTYINELNILDECISTTKNKKELPSSKNILLFNYYINNFFNNNEINNDLKMYYYPLYLWWKITNVIPMRISEFTSLIPRNCLIKENEDYFLIIERSKLRPSKSDAQNKALPILKKYKVTKDIYDLLENYIESTNKFGNSETLLSYRAYKHYRSELDKKYPEEYKIPFDSEFLASKYNEDKFNSDVFEKILDYFCKNIIKGLYNDKIITQMVKPNNTRHFAFTSLMLQGLPHVEIAMLGGHSNLSTLDNYTYNPEIYIDSQVFVNINKNINSKTCLSNASLYEIVFNMPKECPVNNDSCFDTEFDGVTLGVCTSSYDYACESYECYTCSKWYCSPSQYSYHTLCNIVKRKYEEDYNTLNNDLNFMKKILNSSDLLYSQNDNEVALTKDFYTKIENLSKQIQSNASELIKMKSSILNRKYNKSGRNKEYTIRILQHLKHTFSESNTRNFESE